MIWVAIVVEGILKKWPDMGILFALQFINGGVGFYESIKAGNAVAALKASLKPQAHCKRDGKWVTMDSSGLVPGDLVLLGSGGAVPADCIVSRLSFSLVYPLFLPTTVLTAVCLLSW